MSIKNMINAIVAVSVWGCLSLSVHADINDPQQKFANSFRNLQIPECSTERLGEDLSILFVGPYKEQRDSVDLAITLGVSDIGSLMTFSRTELGKKQLVGATYFDQARMPEELAELLERRWDVIVIGNVSWSTFPRESQLAILQAVHSGTGLLYVGLSDEDRFMKRIREEKQVPVPPYITSSVLLDNSFVKRYSKVLDGVTCAQLGQGRVCFVDYVPSAHKRACGQMLTSEREIYSIEPMADICLSFVGRCVLWVTHHVPDFTIGSASISVDGENLALQIEPQPEEQETLSAQVTIRDEYGTVVSDKRTLLIRSPEDKSNFEAPFPDLPNGRVFVEIELLKEDKLMDRTVVFRETKLHQLSIEVQPKQYSFLPDERISGRVNVQFPLSGISVRIELLDNLGRLIERTTAKVENSQILFDFSPVDPLVSLHFICATALKDGREFGKDRASIALKAKPASDFVSCVWVTSPENLPTQQSLLHALKTNGVDVVYAYATMNRSAFIQKYQGQAIARANLFSMPYALRIYFSGSPVNMSRKPCLNDPTYRKQITRIFDQQKANFWQHFPYFYSLGDENALSAYNSADICCSAFCNRDFVAFLQERFDSLDDLNACWQKEYASWGEVSPVLLEKAKKDDYLIPWFYHRMHMDRVYTDIHDFCKRQIRTFDPEAKVGMEGMLCGSTWGGGDYSQLFPLLDFVVPYESGTANEELASFCSSDQNYGSFAGAYIPYLRNESRNCFSPWRTLFSGGNMSIYWQATGIIPWQGIITGAGLRPDHEPYTWFRIFCDNVKDIKKGPATVLRHSKPVHSGVAILYNRLAFYAATASDRKLHSKNFIKLVNDLGVRPEVLTFQGLMEPSFNPETHPVLILPGCEFLPRDVADKISVYMNAGGRVICDLYPRMDMCGKELNLDCSRILLFCPEELYRYHADYGMGDVEAFPWSAAGAEIRTDFSTLVDGVDLKSSVTVNDASGAHAFNCYVTEYENGSERYLCILRYPYAVDGETSDFHIKLQKKSLVYDIREETSVGMTDTMNVNLQPGEAKLFAISPRPHSDLRLSMAKQSSVLSISPLKIFPGKRFFRVEVFSPDGIPVLHYNGNMVVEGDKGEYQVKHALNDVAGEWSVKVTDVVSGNSKVLTYVRKL